MESQGKEKAIEIELVTETQLPSDTTAVQLHQETWKIERVTTEGIQEQQRNLARVRELCASRTMTMATLADLENAIDVLLNHP